MGIAERIASELKDISKTRDLRKHEGYSAATVILAKEHYAEAKRRINALADLIAANGEKILCSVGRGDVVDSGMKGFSIRRGVVLELYDYEEMSAAFIRLYHLSDGKKEWLALYVDENPKTPWWKKEERHD